MNDLQRGNISFEIHQKVIEAKQDIERSFIKLGGLLKEIRDKKIYESLGYEAELDELRLKTNRKQWDDYTLAQILTSKTDDGRYAFVWTSDLEVWGQNDYWDTPNEALTKREDGLYLMDCDGFSAIHCDFLYRKANYPLVWFTEIYWKKKHPDVDAWKNYGHAITVYKRKWEDNFRAFSNQSWLGMLVGHKRFEDIVLVFVPLNKEEFKDRYKINIIKARHPLTGELLFELKDIII